MPPRKKNGEPEILQHTSIRLEDGTVLLPGDEQKLKDLSNEDLDKLQNDHGAIAGFVPARKGASEPPVAPQKTDSGAPQTFDHP